MAAKDDSNNTKKIALAAALLLVAGLVFAWQQGLFSSPPPAPAVTQDVKDRIEKTKVAEQKTIDSGKARLGGAE
jgi:hypothetical protein